MGNESEGILVSRLVTGSTETETFSSTLFLNQNWKYMEGLIIVDSSLAVKETTNIYKVT